MADINSDPNYANSQDINFTPSASPIPAQKAAFDTYNKDFTNFLGSQETPTQIADRYSNKYNVPFLQNQQQQQNAQLELLGNKLQALPASVNSASANSLLTRGQKDRIIQSQSAPLQQNYNNLAQTAGQTTNQLNSANSNINQAISLEQADQLKQTQPWLQKYDAMNIFNAAENTQWNATNQWELNTLLANQQAGVTLSEGQQSRLEALAAQENAFHNQLDLLEKQNEYATELWGL